MEKEQVTEWAIAYARAILAVGGPDEYTRGFLNNCIWMVTEAEGKYNVQYWSKGVYELVGWPSSPEIERKFRPLIRHEHVNTRKSLITKIITDPSCLETVLREEAIACLVTIEEYSRLNDRQVGFERYTTANIPVWDVTNQRWRT